MSTRGAHDRCRPAKYGLGAAGIGNLYRAISNRQAGAVLDAAAQAGINRWDTAPLYGHGLSETRIGRYLNTTGNADITLSTKVGRVLDAASPDSITDHGFRDPLPFNPRFDYSYDGVMSAFESSLARLNVEHIETVFFHDLGVLAHGACHAFHMRTAMTSGLKALHDLKHQGVVGRIGIGANEVAVLEEALASEEFDCFLLAGRYTLFEHEDSLDFMDTCYSAGIPIVIGGPYNSGLLATRPTPASRYDYTPAAPVILERAARFWRVCDQYGVPASAAALQFAASHPAVETVLVGIQDIGHLTELMVAARLQIPDALWSDLIKNNLIHEHAPTPVPSS